MEKLGKTRYIEKEAHLKRNLKSVKKKLGTTLIKIGKHENECCEGFVMKER